MVGTTGNGDPEIDLSVRTHHGRIALRRRPRGADPLDAESSAQVSAWAAAIPKPAPAPIPPAGGSGDTRLAHAEDEHEHEHEHERVASHSDGEPDQLRAILQAVAKGELSPDEADALLDAELSRGGATR